jgi:hypothetical protein
MTAEMEANDPQVEEQRRAREIETRAADDSPDPAEAGKPAELAGAERTLPEGSEDDAAALRRITPADEQRARLADRFKQRRAAAGGQLDFHGDHRDPTQVYGAVASQTTDDRAQTTDDEGQRTDGGLGASSESDPSSKPAPAEAGDRPPSSEKLYRAKVNGVDVLLTEDEVVAEAQKSLAAGDLLAQAKEIYRGAKREASAAPNQGDDPASQSFAPPPGPLPNQEPPIEALIEDLQFGDPEAAGTRLAQTIVSRAERAAGHAAREAVVRERIERELAGAQRTVASFEAANADLARDEFAREAIERQVYREYAEDLKALGIPPGHIPQDPLARASWHNQLRAAGAPVRDMGTILTAARDRFVAWRGGGTPTPKSPREAARAAPRIEVSVNRDERRAVLPTQPTRASVPPKAAAAALPQRGRSDVIAGMRKARGQIVA